MLTSGLGWLVLGAGVVGAVMRIHLGLALVLPGPAGCLRCRVLVTSILLVPGAVMRSLGVPLVLSLALPGAGS